MRAPETTAQSPCAPGFHSTCVQNQFSSAAKYLNGCNSPPDNRKTNTGQFKKGQSEPMLPIYCASCQVYTQDCSVPVPVLRDKRAVPAQGYLIWISGLALTLLFANISWDWKSYIAVGHVLVEKWAAMSSSEQCSICALTELGYNFTGQLFSAEQVDTSKSKMIPSQSICYVSLINTDHNLPEMISTVEWVILPRGFPRIKKPHLSKGT